MKLSDDIKQVLKRIDFVNRYKNIVKKNSFHFNERFEKYSNGEVLSVISKLGYKAGYIKGENFFKIFEKVNAYEFQFNIILKGGIVQLVWDLTKDSVRQSLGGPFGLIISLYNGEEFSQKPLFRNYEDLNEILKESFTLYEDFKREILIKNIT